MTTYILTFYFVNLYTQVPNSTISSIAPLRKVSAIQLLRFINGKINYFQTTLP